jgi:hypothetical protein
MNIDVVAAPMTFEDGFADEANDGRKIGISKVKRQMKSHIPLREILNRSVISPALLLPLVLDTA